MFHYSDQYLSQPSLVNIIIIILCIAMIITLQLCSFYTRQIFLLINWSISCSKCLINSPIKPKSRETLKGKKSKKILLCCNALIFVICYSIIIIVVTLDYCAGCYHWLDKIVSLHQMMPIRDAGF